MFGNCRLVAIRIEGCVATTEEVAVSGFVFLRLLLIVVIDEVVIIGRSDIVGSTTTTEQISVGSVIDTVIVVTIYNDWSCRNGSDVVVADNGIVGSVVVGVSSGWSKQVIDVTTGRCRS